MKRFTTLVALATLLIGTAMADEHIITFDKLPTAAQHFVTENFDRATVTLVKQERGFWGSEYEVVLNNGTKLEFNNDGGWTDIKSRSVAVPTAIIPPQIATFVAQQYSNAKVVAIERDRRGYEVKLDVGVELSFDTQFNCVDVDF